MATMRSMALLLPLALVLMVSILLTEGSSEIGSQRELSSELDNVRRKWIWGRKLSNVTQARKQSNLHTPINRHRDFNTPRIANSNPTREDAEEFSNDVVDFTEGPQGLPTASFVSDNARDGRSLRVLDAETYDELYSDPNVRRALKAGNETQARSFIREKLCLLGLVDCEDEFYPPPPAPLGNVLYVQPIKVLPSGPPVPAVPIGHAPPGPYPPPVPVPPPSLSSVHGYGPPKNPISAHYIADSSAHGSVVHQQQLVPSDHLVNELATPQLHHQKPIVHHQPEPTRVVHEHFHTHQTTGPQFPPTYRPLTRSDVDRQLASPSCTCVPRYACADYDIVESNGRERTPLSVISPRTVNSRSPAVGRSTSQSSRSAEFNQSSVLHQVHGVISNDRETGRTSFVSRRRRDLERTPSSHPQHQEHRVLTSNTLAQAGALSKQCSRGDVCCRSPVPIPTRGSRAEDPQACGISRTDSLLGRIMNYELRDGETSFGEFPWHVAVLEKDGADNVFVCAGTLIGTEYIVTAAHCVSRHEPYQLRVRLGEWDVNRDTEFYPHVDRDVSGLYVHPDFYAGNLVNDIALLKLSSPVDIRSDRHIGSICLPPAYTDFSGLNCIVTGWGKDAFGDYGKYQNILKKVSLPVIPNYQCEEMLRHTRLGYSYHLDKGFLCAGGEEGKDACKGDGGGPLMCSLTGSRYFLAGVVSWGVGCGEKDVPGVYVKVTEYLPWINSITAYRPYGEVQRQARSRPTGILAEEYIEVVRD